MRHVNRLGDALLLIIHHTHSPIAPALSRPRYDLWANRECPAPRARGLTSLPVLWSPWAVALPPHKNGSAGRFFRLPHRTRRDAPRLSGLSPPRPRLSVRGTSAGRRMEWAHQSRRFWYAGTTRASLRVGCLQPGAGSSGTAFHRCGEARRGSWHLIGRGLACKSKRRGTLSGSPPSPSRSGCVSTARSTLRLTTSRGMVNPKTAPFGSPRGVCFSTRETAVSAVSDPVDKMRQGKPNERHVCRKARVAASCRSPTRIARRPGVTGAEKGSG